MGNGDRKKIIGGISAEQKWINTARRRKIWIKH